MKSNFESLQTLMEWVEEEARKRVKNASHSSKSKKIKAFQ
jgi:hypothetical protein